MNNQFYAEPIADAPRVARKPYVKAAMGASAGGMRAACGRLESG